jgi:hypothetical protein
MAEFDMLSSTVADPIGHGGQREPQDRQHQLADESSRRSPPVVRITRRAANPSD